MILFLFASASFALFFAALVRFLYELASYLVLRNRLRVAARQVNNLRII